MPSTSTISREIVKVVKPGMKIKDLIAAVRQRWPQVSKKKILRSAFAALIKTAGKKAKKTGSDHHDSVQPTPTH
ncbi:hypothetical protein [Methylobacterium sp.]|jgi:hypothetical protein|uniref:hypothetical protein n=1 Tax=Methylobacterium sp. TaxID=409 RepID=UPI0025CF6587|nr:hypothetical protein [Methylobacterium sp.]MBY0256456.1 hypothetical protein [Methylobacterium sp.]